MGVRDGGHGGRDRGGRVTVGWGDTGSRHLGLTAMKVVIKHAW